MTEIWGSTLKWPPSGRSAPSQTTRPADTWTDKKKKVKKVAKKKNKQNWQHFQLSHVACRQHFAMRNIEMPRAPPTLPAVQRHPHSLLAPHPNGSAKCRCELFNCKRKNVWKAEKNRRKKISQATSNEILCFLMKIKVKHDLVNTDHLDLDTKCLAARAMGSPKTKSGYINI